jgi:signal transduction histidine kinase
MNVQIMSKRATIAAPLLSLVSSVDWPSANPLTTEPTNALFLNLLGAIPGPVFVKDDHLRFIYVNDAFCALIARARADLMGRTDFDVARSDQAQGFRATDIAVMADGLPRNTAEELIDSRGNALAIVTTKSRFDVPGRSPCLLGLIADHTAGKRAESELITAKLEAESANISKSSFLANMSHELRTPLNAIIGFSEIIKDGLFGVDHQRYRTYADDIFLSGGHLLRLINDILDISKIDAGKFQLNVEAFDVAEAVSAALLFVREAAAAGGVVLHVAIPAGLPLLSADRRAVTQIVTNLVANAVKFTDSGGHVDVAATMVEGCLSISVSDTGIGMKPEDIPLALTPFQQLEGAWDRKYQGTGLGLPLTNAMIALHGGALVIKSQLGLGTTATAHFPKERTVQRRV